MSTSSTITPSKPTTANPTKTTTATTTIKSEIIVPPTYLTTAVTTITTAALTSKNKYVSPGSISLKDEDLKPYDVLCGRGTGPNEYCGNKHFLSLVAKRRSEYIGTSSRCRKHKIAAEIIHQVQSAAPPGRFLEKVKSSCKRSNSPAVWVEVKDEKKFLEKAKQALRETWHRKTPGDFSSSSGSSSSSSSGDDTAPSSAVALAASSLKELSCKPTKRKITDKNNIIVFKDLSNRAPSSSPSKKQKCSPSLPSPQSCVNFPKQTGVSATLSGNQQMQQQTPPLLSGSTITIKPKHSVILNQDISKKHKYWPVPIISKPSSDSSIVGQNKSIGMARMF